MNKIVLYFIKAARLLNLISTSIFEVHACIICYIIKLAVVIATLFAVFIA